MFRQLWAIKHHRLRDSKWPSGSLGLVSDKTKNKPLVGSGFPRKVAQENTKETKVNYSFISLLCFSLPTQQDCVLPGLSYWKTSKWMAMFQIAL